MKKISQREAGRLRKRVRELEEVLRKQRANWANDGPGGEVIARLAPDPVNMAVVKTARKLGHAVVVSTSEGYFYFHAVRLP